MFPQKSFVFSKFETESYISESVQFLQKSESNVTRAHASETPIIIWRRCADSAQLCSGGAGAARTGKVPQAVMLALEHHTGRFIET